MTLAVVGAGHSAADNEPASEQASRILATLPPAELESALADRPAQALGVLSLLAQNLATAEAPLVGRLQSYLAAAGRAGSRRLSRNGPPWSREQVEDLLILLLVDPPRFTSEPAFRDRVLPILESSLASETAPELRDRLLYRLNRLPNFDFRHGERVALAWGAIRRSSQPLRIAFDPVTGLTPDAPDRPIAASVFSFSSVFFEPSDVIALLRAIHRVAPSRALLVLCDLPMRTALDPLAAELPLHLFDTLGRPYSPWIRDVLSFRHDPDGRVVLLLRPDTQIGRQYDAHMGQVLLQNLPASLMSAWRPTWAASRIPFHNGQILQTADSAWISVHSLKAHIRRLTSAREAPAEGRVDPATASDYLEAAKSAAGDLELLLRKPARFVHRMGEGNMAPAVYSRLIGGESFDLDSLLTLLPHERRGLTALVGDLDLGRRLLSRVAASELDSLAVAFDLPQRGEELRKALLATQRGPRAEELQGFLNEISAHLESESVRVRRLPLIRVSAELLSHPRVRRDFLISWNNVTLERRGGAWQAEGFASPLPEGNQLAVASFAEAGYKLYLLPPLTESIARNGGYRCASNHLRVAPAGVTVAR